MLHYLWLIPLGVLIGAFGTMIGAGGGFLLVPLLLMLYPHDAPKTLTSISLAVVFVNALSGSIAYTRQKRVDFIAGVIFAIATIPGAAIGAAGTSAIPRHVFDAILGTLLLILAVYLLARTSRPATTNLAPSIEETSDDSTAKTVPPYKQNRSRLLGTGLSVIIGFLSSVLGIGGGILHGPALSYLLGFPVHFATGTSHFVLAVTAAVATIVHIIQGSFIHGLRRTLCLAIGVAIGAQIGAKLSNRVKGDWVFRGLAVALAAVAVRVLVMAMRGR